MGLHGWGGTAATPQRTFLGMRCFLAAFCLLLALPAAAQQSASFELQETVWNAGGGALASPSYRITLASVGEPAAHLGTSSPSFHADGSFLAAYPPPGEVTGLRFDTHDLLHWSAEPSAGTYDLYRSSLTALAAGGTGACFAPALTAASATDATSPAPGAGLFYLATVTNRLGEEGSKGARSNGIPRPNTTPCP